MHFIDIISKIKKKFQNGEFVDEYIKFHIYST